MNQTFVLLLVSALTVCAQDNQSAVQSNLDRMISNARKADTDKSGAATAPRTSGETVAPATQTPPRRSFDSWASDLRLGSFAGNIAAGVKLATVGYRNTGVRPAGAADVIVGLSPVFGIVGTYSYNDFFSNKGVHGTVNEFIGAVRLTVPRQRIAPFGQFGVGLAMYSSGARGVSIGGNAFSISPGGGVNVNLSSRIAVSMEVRGISPTRGSGNYWYFRSTVGLLFKVGR